MAISPFSAYTSLTTLKPDAAGAPAGPATAKPGSEVTEGFAGFREALQQAEQATLNTAISGADPHAMVEALANAEMMLETAVTIRDKVVEAYQELLRMPV